jgi:hypothetical protein
MCFTGARFSERGRFFFDNSYVEKNAAAVSEKKGFGDLAYCADINESRTSRSAAYHDTSNAFVHLREPARSPKPLGRLKPRFHSINWKKKQVYGSSCYSSGLSGVEHGTSTAQRYAYN